FFNKKSGVVRLNVEENHLKTTANNPEQEEAEEILDVTYSGAEMEIGFNVSYVLDVLNALKCENVCFILADAGIRDRSPSRGFGALYKRKIILMRVLP
ncbi:hypothetical protein JQN46_26025, partial [Enterobacter hormaechei]|nr:hypothetical protein [Enterobacter hormaechei]